jgi:uncharacterized protein YjdB
MSVTKAECFSSRFLAVSFFTIASAVGNVSAYADVSLKATGSDGKITLSWTTTDTLRAVQVMRDTDANPVGRKRLAILPGKLRSYTDNAVVNGRQYWYWIKYTDISRNTGNSNAATATAGAVDNGGTQPIAVTGVSVTPTNASVAVGSTTALSATVLPANATNQSVTWSTSNVSVATVSANGVVTGVAAGSTTITARTADGGRTATSIVTVRADQQTIPVTGVTVTPSATVKVGAIASLTATVQPNNASNKAVTWNSDNSRAATVSSTGVVTGVAEGAAKITVATVDGDRTATSAITVTREPAPEPGKCSRKASACTAPAVTLSDINVGVAVRGYGQEGDTDPLPMSIAAMPSGGSQLAWLGTDNRVYVAKLDCNDKLVGTPTSFPAVDLQDLQADDNGGVVLLTRNATNGGPDNCGNGNLCGGTSSQCKTMHMVRFDDAGKVQWEQQVTNLSDKLAGYDNGARFVWWYQHHGRLAFDGNSNYAAYFGTAITVNNGSCVDIHEGDRMQVVNSSGALLSRHPDSFEVGCSHAWQSRMVWDPRTSHFVMVCATDNECRIAQPNPYRTVASGSCDGTLFGGDLVLSSKPGYWTAWSQGEQVRLEHFTNGASDTTINTGARSSHPHLVSYGANRMLLTWASGASMAAQVFDSATGQPVGGEFSIDANDHSYQAFKAYPDGSAAYPAVGNNSTSIRVARVMPCNN